MDGAAERTDVAGGDSAGVSGAGALEALFSAQEGNLLVYALRLVRDRGTAEDLVQEAFLRLCPRFATVAQPRAWLYRTVHNLAMNHHRSRRKLVDFPGTTAGGDGAVEERDAAPLPDEKVARLEAVGCARTFLQGLDERRRELIRLKFDEGLSYKEISERLGIGIGNVGYLLHHLLKDLAAELRKNGHLS